jgi:hypothetical protein
MLTQATSDRDTVRDAIGRAAQRTGIDFQYLLNQAKSESNLNPNAKAVTSSASGLYQFIDQTWLGVVKQHGAKHGFGWAANAIQQGSNGRYYVADAAMRKAVFALRNQAEPSALMAAESAGDNAQRLSASLGRDPNATDLYFAHFLGSHGATRFLKAHQSNPDSMAASLFPREASVNRGIFYDRSGQARSLDQVYAMMSHKISGVGSGRSDRGAPVQMASANSDLAPVPSGVDADTLRIMGSAEMPASTADTNSSNEMLAMMGRNGGMQILRPSPQSARLAYLLLSGDFTDPTVTS